MRWFYIQLIHTCWNRINFTLFRINWYLRCLFYIEMLDIEGLIDSQDFMRINHLFLMFRKDNFRSVKISKNFSVIFHLIFSVFSVYQSFVNSSVLNLFNCSCQWKCKISNDWLAAKIFFLLNHFFFFLTLSKGNGIV